MKDSFDDYKEELVNKKDKIQYLEVGMTQMSYIFKDFLDCSPPSRIYLVFLKDQWCHVQLKRIRENTSYNLETSKYLSDMCHEVIEK